MAKSTLNPRKKRGRPPVDSDQVNVRLPRAAIEEAEKLAKKKGVGKTVIIRNILVEGLMKPPKVD